eukprot:COSAG05_NODE_20653_length_278_cov_0.413408_1_plen_68_part_10
MRRQRYPMGWMKVKVWSPRFSCSRAAQAHAVDQMRRLARCAVQGQLRALSLLLSDHTWQSGESRVNIL